MTEIGKAQVAEIVSKMRGHGFDVFDYVFEDSLAFKCPPRSRLMFGAVIAEVLGGAGNAVEMLLAAQTSHDRETRIVTLYFPGYTFGA